MAAKHLEVETYKLYFRPDSTGSWAFPGNFYAEQCYGYVQLRAKGSFDIFYLVILDNNVPTMPASTTYNNPGTGDWIGAAALKLENLHGILDLLRNEKPIYMCLSDTLPMSNYISTSEEPVGEGIDMSP